MWWYILPGGIGFCSLLVIAGIVYRAFPRLAIIDVSTIAHEREAARKHQIILERAERLRASFFRKVRQSLQPRARAVAQQFQKWYTHAVELEKRYRHLGVHTAGGGVEQVTIVLDAAQSLAKAGKSREAEEKFIEAVTLAPKYAKAYEELGRFYVQEKQWAEAREAFDFLLKMDAKDASARANIGELFMAEGKPDEAIPHFSKAIALKPANPRLQALLLEAAIGSMDKELAVKTFAQLKETAPQFPILPDFEERIRRM